MRIVKGVVIGLTLAMALGAMATTSALAGPGPFFHGRIGGEGPGEKIEETAPEPVSGSGELIDVETTILGKAVTISCTVTIEGKLFNLKTQGHIDTFVKFTNCKIPGTTCVVTDAEEAEYGIELGWKYAGKPEELKLEKQQPLQKPDWIVYTKKGGGKLGSNVGVLGTFKISGEGCAFNSTSKLEGSLAAESEPGKTEAFAKAYTLTFPGGNQGQHFYNGTEQVPFTTATKLTVEGKEVKEAAEAKVKGKLSATAAKREIAIFEN